MASTLRTVTSSSTCLEEESSELRREKQVSIRRCLDTDPIDLWQLRELALTRGGLVNAEIRQEAWHILIGSSEERNDDKNNSEAGNSLNEKELELICCDAGRSVIFRYDGRENDDTPFLVPSGESTFQGDIKFSDRQEQLTATLLSTLDALPKFNYYQGLHDVAGVLLYNLEEPTSAGAILKRLARIHLRDAMRNDLSALVEFVNAVFMPLLQAVDEELCHFLLDSGMDCCNSILPWLITWFTHDIHNPEVASRLVDAFMSSHALLPLYFAVALLVHPQHRIQIFQADFDPASVSIGMKNLTSCISSDWSSPSESSVSAQDLIDDAITFMRRHPPRSLLTLAREHSGVDSLSLMEISSSVSFLRPPPSWAMASFLAKPTPLQHNDKENTENTADTQHRRTMDEEDVPAKESSASTARAKIASGIPFLLSDADEATILSKRLEEAPPPRSESPRGVMMTKWELCQQVLFASFSTESCGGSPSYCS